jgi:single-stranded-DNA-specific exonuclease
MKIKSLLDHNRRWRVKKPSFSLAKQISQELGCSLALAKVLAARADKFRLPPGDLLRSLEINPPFLMKGMKEAVERLKLALERGEKVFIHGDFDVDGLTSAALLHKNLKEIGFKGVKVEISDRQRGHGLNPQVIRRVIAEGFGVLITSDCGISDYDHVKALQRNKVDVIITDHHHPPPKLPPALAVINPKQPSCVYPNKWLAGVGVAFQLTKAFYQVLGITKDFDLDLVMLGTVADLVPLIKDGQVENKVLVERGLEQITQGKGSLGLRVLIERLSLKPPLSAGEIGYIVAPKLNAANRVGDPRVAFLLLTTQEKERAEYLSEILMDYNYDRQIAQDDLLYQAGEMIPKDLKDKIIILEGKYWNPGIIGLVASDLVERYYLPAILISIGERESLASGRSIPEFDLIKGLERHSHLLERWGGHSMAAGFSIRNENLDRLKDALREYANEKLADYDGPVFEVDCPLEVEEITSRLYKEVQSLAPFGMGNPEPRFLLGEVRLYEAQTVGGGRHLKLKLAVGDHLLEAIGFDMGNYITKIYQADKIAVVFRVDQNTWDGVEKVQLKLEDVVKF